MVLGHRFKDDVGLLSSENSDNPRAIGSEIRVLSARPKDCNFEARSEVTCCSGSVINHFWAAPFIISRRKQLTIVKTMSLPLVQQRKEFVFQNSVSPVLRSRQENFS